MRMGEDSEQGFKTQRRYVSVWGHLSLIVEDHKWGLDRKNNCFTLNLETLGQGAGMSVIPSPGSWGESPPQPLPYIWWLANQVGILGLQKQPPCSPGFPVNGVCPSVQVSLLLLLGIPKAAQLLLHHIHTGLLKPPTQLLPYEQHPRLMCGTKTLNFAAIGFRVLF